MKRQYWSSLAIIAAGLFLFSAFEKAEAATILDGLVASYEFSGSANDLSGNNNHGTVNGATLTNDRLGNVNSAYSFGGADDYVMFPSLNFNSELTVSTWVKYSSLGSMPQPIINKYDGDRGLGNITTIRSFDLFRHMTQYNGVFAFTASNDGINTSTIHSNTSPLVNQWYHVAATFNSGAMSIYVNGKLENTQDAGFSNIYQSPVNIIAGANTLDYPTIGAPYTDGSIDDIRIYNRALSASEINTLYSPVPLPAAMLLFGSGLLGLVGTRFRRKKQ